MANITLGTARTNTAQLCDDASNARWTTAQIDEALAGGLSRSIAAYVGAGGDRFDLETTGTSSATTGLLDVSSVVPFVVKQVAVVVGDSTYRIYAKSPMRRGYVDLTARSLRVLYVREYALPTDSSHPLVGVGATGANSWRAFDDLVCAEAAAQLLVKDSDARQRLEMHRVMCERAVLSRMKTPGGYPMPRPQWSPTYSDLAWQFIASSSNIALLRGSASG